MKTNIIKRVEQALNWLSDACVVVGGCLLVFLLIIFGWLVFGRYVMNDTPTWVEQMALVLICYIVFLGAAAGIRENTHLGVTFIREAMPAPIRRFLRFAVDVVLLVFGIIMFVACSELFKFGLDTKLPMLNVPESVRTFPAAACGAMIFLFSSARVFGRIANFFAPKPEMQHQES